MLRTTYDLLRRIGALTFERPRLQRDEIDYNGYWRHKRSRGIPALSSFQQQRADWAVRRIQSNTTILDIGAGEGSILRYLSDRCQATGIGADVSDVALEHLASLGLKTVRLDPLRPGDLRDCPDVDYVLLFEVLEHVPDAERLLRAACDKARRAVFFSVPNSGFFPYRLRLLFGSFLVQWRVHPGEHVRFWTYRDLKWWLGELGYLDRCELHAYEGVPALNRLWGSLFGMGYVGVIKCE